MTFRKLMMLAGIGGLVYAHRKRGGQMTLESFKQSGRDLLDGVKNRASDIRTQAETRLHDAASKVADKTGQQGLGVSDDSSVGSGIGSTGYDYGRNR